MLSYVYHISLGDDFDWKVSVLKSRPRPSIWALWALLQAQAFGFLQKQEPFLCIRCDLPGASTKKLETQHFDASSLFCHSRLFAIFNRSFSGFDCICFSERSLGYGRIGERFFGISR
jgi:hypothetical protein